MSVDPAVLNKYRAGFNECAYEVNRYLGTVDGLNTKVRMRLMQHLANSLNQVDQAASVQSRLPFCGIPAGTALAALPRVGERVGLPLGGLAMSPESPTIPLPPQSPLSSPSSDYRGTLCTNTTTKLSVANQPGKSRNVTVTDQTQSRREDMENLAPLSPGSGLPITLKSEGMFDRNNNAALPDRERAVCANSRNGNSVADRMIFNNNHALAELPRAAIEVALKQEPVWRPW